MSDDKFADAKKAGFLLKFNICLIYLADDKMFAYGLWIFTLRNFCLELNRPL